MIYAFLIVGVRVVGRRQLGQLTVIDLVVILVLGSAVETAMIHGNTSLAAGLVSVTTLLAVNALLTRVFLRSARRRRGGAGGPLILVRDGRPVEEHLKRAGMSMDDLLEALRGRGYSDTSGIGYAVLETDGTVSVIPASASADQPEPEAEAPD